MQVTTFLLVAFSWLLAVGPTHAQDVPEISTRYGSLTASTEGKLLFRRKAVQPVVRFDGSRFTQPVARFTIGASEVILFVQWRGSRCPGNYVFVTVTAWGARATRNFGTCYDDATEPVQTGRTITFSMPNLGGEGQSVFTYENGTVLQNGEPIG